MDSSIFALNPSLNNDLGSSLKDFSNTIWRVGRPRPTIGTTQPYHWLPKQQTPTHIFIELCRTCCLCYGEAP